MYDTKQIVNKILGKGVVIKDSKSKNKSNTNVCEVCGAEYNYYEGETPEKYALVCSDGCYKKLFGKKNK